jgi:tetratricopeptide (TPR) repeat protein
MGEVPRRLTPVFRDREELASATDLGVILRQALADSACQIVVCSPQAAKSRWVNEEILAFKRLGREDRIFALIVGGEPNASDMPGREDEECFPPALRFHLGPDGQLSDVRTEPIAADARPGKDGRTNAKLKLIAALLGVGFDLLRRRDAQRRNRRIFFIAVASTIGMVAAIALAAFALVQRSQALRQEARAEREADAANQATNFLIGLFKIIDPGEARGNTVTAREVLDKGAARIDAELARQPLIQARLMDTIGSVYTGLGLYREAAPLLERAVVKRRELNDTTGLSESLLHYGLLQNNQAKFDQAEKAYREAAALAAAQPKDRRSRIALASSLYGLGAVLEGQGNFAEAERDLRRALALQHQLYGARHGDIALTLKTLARTLDDNGDSKQAIPLMREALAMQRELRGSEPHPDLAETVNDLGLLLEENGDYDEAERLYREALALKHRLYGQKHPEIAMGLNNLAFVMQDKGELAEAEATYRQALAMQRETLGEVHPDVANTLNNLAFVQDDRGDTRGALVTEREALRVYQQLFPGDHPSVAGVLNRIGFWLTLQGDYPQAERYLEDGLAMRRRLFDDTHPDVASSQENLAILQVATYRYAEALVSSQAAAATLGKALSPTHWRTAIAESAEGAAQTGLGNYAEAQKLLDRSYAILRKDPNAPKAFRILTEHYLQVLKDAQRPRRGARPGAVGTLR